MAGATYSRGLTWACLNRALARSPRLHGDAGFGVDPWTGPQGGARTRRRAVIRSRRFISKEDALKLGAELEAEAATFTSIENATGSIHNDALIGNARTTA